MSATSTKSGKASPAGSSSEDGPALPRWHFELPSFRTVAVLCFGLLLVMGIALWVAWSLAYHDPFDNGLYAVTITLVAFGLAGIWLMTPSRRHVE